MKTYQEKLKDPRWQRKRLKVFDRDGWKCQECGNDKEMLAVHHKKYHGEPWQAPLKELITVCDTCHHFLTIEKNFKIKRYGKHGVCADDETPCPYMEYYDCRQPSCRSSSGDSFCLGFWGLRRIKNKWFVRCTGEDIREHWFVKEVFS